jgi:hypothetical protein
MLGDLSSAKEIARLTEGLLQRADAAGRWPTPVGDILQAAELTEPHESPLDRSILAKAPAYLRNAVELIGSRKIRALLDRRERTVHLDPQVDNERRRAFLRLHEASHDLFPWQSALAYADSDLTLSPRTRRLFEQEANQGAAELLFQRKRFRQMAAEYRIGMGAVGDLADTAGASLQAALRRYAETHRGAVCGLVLEPSPLNREPLTYRRREVSPSKAWAERFGRTWPSILSSDAFTFLRVIQSPHDDVPLTFPDCDCHPVEIRAEARSSRYGVLVVLWVPQRERLKRKRVLAA